MALLHNPIFWTGILLAPIPWVLLIVLLGFSNRQVKAIKEWYVGLPITQWLAMYFIVIGCQVVKTKKYCHFMTYEGRHWVSPNVDGFKAPELDLTPKPDIDMLQ